MNKLLSIIPLFLFISSCTTVTYEHQDVVNIRDELRSSRSYAYDEWLQAEDSFDKYYKGFLVDNQDSTYYPIWFNSIDEKMNAVIFKPIVQSKGTVLVIHGYAGNSRGFRYIGNELLQQGYTVAALSLPGHGLAGGDRGDINDFNDYGVVVKDFIKILEDHDLTPDYAIGHSTGASSLIIYNQNYSWDFKEVIFIAPLIKSSFWYPSVITRFLTRPFLKKLNTRWSGPLAVHVFPMHWFDELIKWNKELKDYDKKLDDIFIIQGKKDDVVKWKYNLKVLKKIYTNANIKTYTQGTHTLFLGNEGDSADINNKILEIFN